MLPQKSYLLSVDLNASCGLMSVEFRGRSGNAGRPLKSLASLALALAEQERTSALRGHAVRQSYGITAGYNFKLILVIYNA